MSRAVLAVVAAAALAWMGPAVAQTQSTGPTAHAGTKLNFPATLGGAQFERSVNYAGPPANRPDLGYSYYYSTPKKMVIAVQVFDGGRRVPPGSDNPTVVGEFTNELASTEEQIKSSGYTRFRAAFGAVDLRLRRRDLPVHHLQCLDPGEHARPQQAPADRLSASTSQDPHRLGAG